MCLSGSCRKRGAPAAFDGPSEWRNRHYLLIVFASDRLDPDKSNPHLPAD